MDEPMQGELSSMNLETVRTGASPVSALRRLLEELATLLSGISTEVYCAGFVSEVSGSIGEHVRHCLDHVSALVAADPAVTLSYDHRHRGTLIEADRTAALERIEQLGDALAGWATRSMEEPVRVESKISPSGEVAVGWSTLARELAFVVSHTIHHQAIIGLLLAIHGRPVPSRFGHSPTTPRRH
jgi:uncharacterized damage-inducible protein DinB